MIYPSNRCLSGVTEGLNTRIKLILRQSYGFKNFDLMKEKLLACLSPEERESRRVLFSSESRSDIDSPSS
ncbi:transposase [Chamaesiphon sp.]|uniref:transposase n=1 Tax=Chamaesiphon sp. TaxID=2814140 RepID=UPI0035938D7E